MQRAHIVFAALFLLTMTATKAEKPWFCHGLDCPDYTVVETTSDYEVRQYSAGKWASTVIEGYGYDKAVKTAFWRLFKYIGGANDQKQKIKMTAPVRVTVQPSDGPYCKSNFTISFFVPEKYQMQPPTPSAEDVFIEDSEAFTAYVASYGGWNSEEKVVKHASELFELLNKQGVEVESDKYYTAGYDSPFRLMNRHNEIWLIKRAKAEERQAHTESVLRQQS